MAIAAGLLAQIAIPLSYYLGRDAADERFAWRMFSSASQRSCDASLEVARSPLAGNRWRPLPLRGRIRNEWMASLVLGQPRVVEGVLELACVETRAESTRYEQRCLDAAGAALAPSRRWMDCRSRVMRKEGTPP